MSWYRFPAAAVLCLLPGALIAAAEAASAPYVVQVQIAVAARDVSFNAEAHSVTTGDGTGFTSVGEIETMRVGDLELDLDSPSIWGGHDTPPEGSGVELLSAPQVIIPAATKGTVRTGTVAQYQYLERRDADCYIVQTLPPEASPRIVLTIVPTPGPPTDDGRATVTLDFHLKVTTIGNREPVPGLNLDVGRPIIASNEVDRRLTARLGRWNLLTSHIGRNPDAAEPETLFVLVRITRRAG